MSEICSISKTAYTMHAAWYTTVAFAGGSLSVAIGASNTATTSWRRLFMQYLRQAYQPMYNFQISEVMAALGAIRSPGLVFTLNRNVIPFSPTIVFVEEVYNDFTSPDKEVTRKAVEGIVRQLRTSPSKPDIVFLGAGCKPGFGDAPGGLLDHSLHREIADHYGIPFIDLQSFVMEKLAQRGQSWEQVGFDSCHLNDYGQQMWFECMREWFDKQMRLYETEPTRREHTVVPPVLYSDEMQFTKLVNPAKKSRFIELEGSWDKAEELVLPWYLDNVIRGRPGDKLRFTFSGTAISLCCLTYNNGLKIEATVDGEDVAGPYTNFGIEHGTFHLLKHGMEKKEHVLELTVGKPLKARNKLEDPTAMIAYLAVATGEPEKQE